MPTTHTALSVPFFLLHTAVGNGAKNKFRVYFQWRNEHFKPRLVILCRQLRFEYSTILATALWTLHDVSNWAMMTVAKLTPVRIHNVIPTPTVRWNSFRRWLRIIIAISCTRWRRIFKRKRAITGWGTDRPLFQKNLRAFLLNDDGDLSNEPTFS